MSAVRVIRQNAALVVTTLVVVAAGSVPDEARGQEVDGDRIVRAERATTRPVVDGRLDDAVWSRTGPLESFTQIEPSEGATARADTDVRIVWDDHAIYVAARLTDPPGRGGTRVEGLRRDFGYQNSDVFAVLLDGFGDGRSGMAFMTNPNGVQRDLLAFDGRETDPAWNGVWTVRTAQTEEGWTAEFEIPWATLRYQEGSVWRLNVFREARALQETSAWAPWQRGLEPWDLSDAGRLVGIRPPPPTLNLQVVPYAVGRAESEGSGLTDDPERSGDVGLDVKWAIGPGTVLDLTANTDFAQAEVDRQVVDLGRFSVFFPERRSFFLESSGIFDTGLDVVSPFYSRRIGLDATGAPVPVTGGARLTHRSSTASAGALVVRQEGSGGTDGTVFGVGRYSRNVGSTGRIGGLVATRWDEGRTGSEMNTAAAVDFFARPTTTLVTRAMVSRTFTEGPGGDGWAAHAWVGNNAPWGYVGWLQEYVGGEWEPRSGFRFASDVVVTSPAFNLDLRPEWLPSGIRSVNPGATAYLFHRASTGEFFSGTVRVSPVQLNFQNGGRSWIAFVKNWQDLSGPFRPVPGLEIDPGDYEFTRFDVAYEHDPSADVSATAQVAWGPFYDGELFSTDVTAKFALSPRVLAFAGWEMNRFDGVGGRDRTTHLVTPELRLAASPRLELSGIWQYNTAVESSSLNLRLTWEFRPLSFLYVVYNDNASLDGALDPFETRRQLIVKATWLWQP